MIIKKFVAKSEKEATEEAERELGKGIVIMNVRPVKQEGFLAFLRPPRVEVTVALEDEPEDVPLGRPQHRDGRDNREKAPAEPLWKEVTPQARSREISESERLVQATKEGKLPPLHGVSNAKTIDVAVGDKRGGEVPPAAKVPAAPAAMPSKIVVDTAPVRRREEKTPAGAGNVGVIEEKLDSLHTLLEERIASSGKDEDRTGSKGEKENQVGGLPEEMLTFVKLLYTTLLSNEVDEIYANQLTDEVEKMNKPNMPLEYVLANVYQKMVLKFGKSELIEPSAGRGPKVIFFIGPTGVGKTTTIAKIASELYVMQKKKVALLTVDTYRIAAAEQLKTYASIMEIPFRVIYSVEEMQSAAESLKDYDFLLVDTPGHSMHNEEQRNSIESFLHAFDGILQTDVFLVLAATTKYLDLVDIADTYTAMTKYRLIFTKLDETRAAGNLYNIKLHTGAPMSYITNGQNVPDDIAVFDAQSVVKALLGGKKGFSI
ncbi:MAG: flagellar biosynthesis protein FlhF [Lachnospiraceae bacterium]|nr:flagellar biosynthesis protein FlhF [Lachnospiraceae bacterium]